MAARSAGAPLGPSPPERTPEGLRGSSQATSQCRRPTPFSVRPGASLISGQTKRSGKAAAAARGPPVLLPLEHAARLEAPAAACGCPDELAGCVPNSATAPKHILLLCPPLQLPTHTPHPHLRQHPRTPSRTQVARQVGKHTNTHTEARLFITNLLFCVSTTWLRTPPRQGAFLMSQAPWALNTMPGT